MLCVALCAAIGVRAQIADPRVISTCGGSSTAGGIQLDQTIGEPVTTTVEAQGIRLTQGFQQQDPVRLRLNMRAFLQGPFVIATGSMHDSLRSAGYLPMNEPYTALGYAQSGGGGGTTSPAVLALAGANAVVDWMLLELRDPNDSTLVVATRCALLQRDGDLVEVDGTSPVAFGAPKGDYYVVARHYNHFGVMTQAPVTLGTTALALDLTNGSTPTHGVEAQKIVGAVRLLWAGDVNGDDVIKYTGAGNDRDLVLSAIGGVVPTHTTTGYERTDVNLDGTTKYTGANNDRDVILQNIGGAVPTNTRQAQLP